MSNLFSVPSKFHERMSFANVILASMVIVAAAVFMAQGRDERLLLVIAPIWGVLWLISGIKERHKRLQREAEIQRRKSRLAENR